MSATNKVNFLPVHLVSTMALVILIANCFIAPAFADGTISARYMQPRGDHIRWKIRIPEPLPAAVIVIQYIIPGSDVLESSHQMSSYDKENGIAKWLITPKEAMTLKMDMKISKPIQKKGEIRGEVMFKDESQTTTASIFMKPRAKKKAFEGC